MIAKIQQLGGERPLPAYPSIHPSIHPSSAGLRMLLPITHEKSAGMIHHPHRMLQISLGSNGGLRGRFAVRTQPHPTLLATQKILFIAHSLLSSSFGRILHHIVTQHSGSQLPNMGQEL